MTAEAFVFPAWSIPLCLLMCPRGNLAAEGPLSMCQAFTYESMGVMPIQITTAVYLLGTGTVTPTTAIYLLGTGTESLTTTIS